MRNEVKKVRFGVIQTGDERLEGLYELANRCGERERLALQGMLEVVWYFRDGGDAEREEEALELLQVLVERAGLSWY